MTFLLARRPGRRTPLERALEPRGLERWRSGPLGFGASRRLLSERLGLVVPHQILRRIVDSTLGNPLFVLEVGRALREQGVPGFREDIPVPDAVEDMLGIRVAGLAPALRRPLLAVALSADPRSMSSSRSRARRPSMTPSRRGFCSSTAAGRERRIRCSPRRPSSERDLGSDVELHRELAAAVSDRGLRALHLALATSRPDAALAAIVADAAAAASARGPVRRPRGWLSTRCVSAGEATQRGERLLALAGYLEAAGNAPAELIC